MSLTKQIDTDWKIAMKSGDPIKSALSQIRAEFKKAAIDSKLTGDRELDDVQAITVLGRMAKQRKESIEEYQKANREDLVSAESAELTAIQKYLPTQLSESEIVQAVLTAIKETSSVTVGDVGKVMRILAPKMKGKADGKKVRDLVEETLKNVQAVTTEPAA